MCEAGQGLHGGVDLCVQLYMYQQEERGKLAFRIGTLWLNTLVKTWLPMDFHELHWAWVNR